MVNWEGGCKICHMVFKKPDMGSSSGQARGKNKSGCKSERYFFQLFIEHIFFNIYVVLDIKLE